MMSFWFHEGVTIYLVQTVFAWLLIILVCGAAYPWAAWLLAKNPRDDGRSLTVIVGFALSVGMLTLLMLWEALLGVHLQWWSITLPFALLMLVGWLLWLGSRDAQGRCPPTPKSLSHRMALLIVAIVSAATLFNAAYWPFSRTDAQRIYARYGRVMWIEGTLVSFVTRDDSFYQAYPVLVPMTITYTYLASGWKNEYLARIIPTLLSLGCLPAAYVLGKMLYGEQAGVVSLALLALTPAFGRWASAGYVDLPMAFFYTLAAIFAWRLRASQHWTDALLAGVMMGLAAWTKNAALPGIPLLAVWLVWLWVKREINIRLLALSLAACAGIAAPWYVRTLAEAGMIIPPTAWTDQAQPNLDNLLIFITHPEIFGLTGWAIAVGLIATTVQALRRAQPAFLLLWTLPYFGFWWLLLSYDSRFLLMFLPPLVVLGGAWCVKLWERIPALWQKRLLPLGVALGLLLALHAAWLSVEFKDALLRHPLMSHEEKLALIEEGS